MQRALLAIRSYERLRPFTATDAAAGPSRQTKRPAGHGHHGLQAGILADPGLAVSESYGARHQRIGIQTGPSGRWQPVPATTLSDASDVPRCVDQQADYQRRSDPGVVLAALRAHISA